MALAALGNFFQNNSKTAAASFVAALGANVNTDELLVVVVASDNRATTDTDDSLHTSLKIQTTGAVDVLSFTKVAEWTNGQTAADAGATVSVWWAICNGNYTTAGHQLRLDLAASKTARAMAGHRFSRDAAKTVEVVGTPLTNAADGATSAGSLATSGLASEEHLHVRGLAYEGPNATLTLSTNFTSLTSSSLAHTTGGGAATNIGARGEYRINTSTGETSNPSWSTAADQASILAVFRELAAGTAWDPGTQADALGVTDTADVSVGRVVSPADALGVTDARALDTGLVVADALGVTDSPTPSLGLVRSASDALGLTDLADAFKVIPVAVDDALGIVDQQALLATLERTVADALGVTDAQALGRGLVLADALGATDTAASSGAYIRSVPDTLGITDNTTAAIILLTVLADGLGVVDVVAFDRGVVLADALALADAPALVAAHLATLADPVAITDALQAGLVYSRTVADALGVTDQAAAMIVLLAQLADALAVADAAALGLGYARAVDDPLAVTDGLAQDRVLATVDALVVSDAVVLPLAGPPAPNLRRPLSVVFVDRSRARILDELDADEQQPGSVAAPLDDGAAGESPGGGLVREV